MEEDVVSRHLHQLREGQREHGHRLTLIEDALNRLLHELTRLSEQLGMRDFPE